MKYEIREILEIEIIATVEAENEEDAFELFEDIGLQPSIPDGYSDTLQCHSIDIIATNGAEIV